MLLVDPCQRLQELLANFFALSRAFDSAARHSSARAIPQFAQDAMMAATNSIFYKEDFQRPSAIRTTISLVFTDGFVIHQ
jgi:hypothetical protein